MKQPKKLTRDHKEIFRKNGLDWDAWALLSEHPLYYIYINKKDGSLLQRYKDEKEFIKIEKER